MWRKMSLFALGPGEGLCGALASSSPGLFLKQVGDGGQQCRGTGHQAQGVWLPVCDANIARGIEFKSIDCCGRLSVLGTNSAERNF